MEERRFKTVILHNFTRDEALALVRAAKGSQSNPDSLIFATTTPTSWERPIQQVVADLEEEHAYFLKNPPPKQSFPQTPGAEPKKD